MHSTTLLFFGGEKEAVKVVWVRSVVKVKRIRSADGGAEAGEVTSGQTGGHKDGFLKLCSCSFFLR